MRISRNHLLAAAGVAVGVTLVITVANGASKSIKTGNHEQAQRAAQSQVEADKMEAYVRTLGWVPTGKFYNSSYTTTDADRIAGVVQFGACRGLEVYGDNPFNASSVIITIQRPTGGRTSGDFDTATYPIAAMPYRQLRSQAAKFGAEICFLDPAAPPK